MLIEYKAHNFSAASLATIEQANDIVAEYTAAGFVLTVRQIFYQFVARNLIEGVPAQYNRMKALMSRARLAGLVDWEAIEDRTRKLEQNPHWTNPQSIVAAAADSFRLDKWSGQPNRVEVWIEKAALLGVIEGVCRELDVDWYACRGYDSQSQAWRAGRRFAQWAEGGQTPWVLYLGDHDPSGLDMARDNQRRLLVFSNGTARLKRIALTMEQIAEHSPPANFAKESDSRHGSYYEQFGDDTWELDALDPRTIAVLIESEVLALRDDALWLRRKDREIAHQTTLSGLVSRWSEVSQIADREDD